MAVFPGVTPGRPSAGRAGTFDPMKRVGPGGRVAGSARAAPDVDATDNATRDLMSEDAGTSARLLTTTELRTGIEAATSAWPSSTPVPWRILATPRGIEMHADIALHPSGDVPAIRQLYIDCGAALLRFRVAVGSIGWSAAVQLLPDPSRPRVLAFLRAHDRTPAGDADRDLAAQLWFGRPRSGRHRRARRGVRPERPASGSEVGAGLAGGDLTAGAPAVRATCRRGCPPCYRAAGRHRRPVSRCRGDARRSTLRIACAGGRSRHVG